MPFSVWDEASDVAAVVAFQLQVNPAHIVRPRPKLHLAQLVVERKPRDVDLARAQKKSRRNPETVAVGRDDHIRRKRTVNVLVCAECTALQNCVILGSSNAARIHMLCLLC